ARRARRAVPRSRDHRAAAGSVRSPRCRGRAVRRPAHDSRARCPRGSCDSPADPCPVLPRAERGLELVADCPCARRGSMTAYAAQLKRPTAEGDRLISEHIEIARRISMRMARRCPEWIAREDLVAAGLLGLTEAAERYDANRNEPFLAFAEKRIRGAVLDELRRGDIMPRRARQMARKIGQTIQELEKKTGRSPTDEEVAAALGVTLEAYRTDLEHLVHVTVGALDQADDTTPALATDDSSPEAGAARGQALSRVRAALPRL